MRDPIFTIMGDADTIPDPIELALGDFQLENVEPEANVHMKIFRLLVVDLIRRQVDPHFNVLSCYRIARCDYDPPADYQGSYVIHVPPSSPDDDDELPYLPFDTPQLEHSESRIMEYDSDFEELYDVEQGCHMVIHFIMKWNADFCLRI